MSISAIWEPAVSGRFHTIWPVLGPIATAVGAYVYKEV